MSINDFTSVTHISCNENQREEIRFEYRRSVWQRITGQPATIKTFECCRGTWFNKDTGSMLDWRGKEEIHCVKQELKYLGKISQWA